MQVKERLELLRNCMKDAGVDGYIITTEDFHASEYVGAYFRAREYMSGFTGSAGTLVVLMDEAQLFTDGRYFIQAEEQLAGSTIGLMKSGQPGVPEIDAYLREHLSDNSVLGFDGRTVSVSFAEKLKQTLAGKQITLNGDMDLVGAIWKERPELSHEPAWELPAAMAGESRADKLKRIRANMQEAGADILLVSALDEIAWTLNLRGNDIACNPVFLSYMLVSMQNCILYVNDTILTDGIVSNLALDGVQIKPYNDIYRDLLALGTGEHLPSSEIWGKSEADKKTVLLFDGRQTNFKLKNCIPETVQAKDAPSFLQLMKAKKNQTECENGKKAHIKDGVAVTKFICWLKNRISSQTITEIDAVEKLEAYRKEQEGYLEPSFDTIAAYGPHGAIVHYEPTGETNIALKPMGFLLVDSGGQYMEGTTDITRTIALGALTEEEKRAYTLVLAGHLNLAAAKFLYGVRGENLDYIAREPLWRYGMDFNHGTGHGVGCLLNVHEGPNRIHFRISKDRPETAIFEEGMITSNEPGLYVAGKFGIRHENLLLCKKAEKTEYGQFMQFENLTWAPFDTEAIIPSLLSDREVERLNVYQETVYEKIAPFLDEEERNWLWKATRPISK